MNNPLVKRAPTKVYQPIRQWQTMSICNNLYTLTGYSRAADRTMLYIPQLKLCLDAGDGRGRQPKYVFVTHTHKDHCFDIGNMSMKPGTRFFMPESVVDVAQRFIAAEWDMNTGIMGLHAQLGLDKEYVITPAVDGNMHMVTDNIQVRVFKCDHRVPCVGYAFSQLRQKLKHEYIGLPGKEIVKLKQEGIIVTEAISQPLFAYCGDTTTKVFDDNPWLFDYPTIITECTYIYDNESTTGFDDKPECGTVDEAESADTNSNLTPLQKLAIKYKHVHWLDLAPIIASHPNVKFILTHFSLRYREDEIYNFFEQEATKANLDNVTLFVCPYSEGRTDG